MEFPMNREEAEKYAREFNERLNKLLEKNPRLTPDSPELKNLIKEFNDRGMPIRIVRESDLVDGLAGVLGLLKQMGMNPNQKGNGMPPENYPQGKESFETEDKPCRFHVKGLDDTNRTSEIGKNDVQDLSINLNTMTDEEIWKNYFGTKG